MEPTDRRAMTVTQAANMLGISRALAYELVRRHELPAIHLGRRIIVPRHAIDTMLEGWNDDEAS